MGANFHERIFLSFYAAHMTHSYIVSDLMDIQATLDTGYTGYTGYTGFTGIQDIQDIQDTPGIQAIQAIQGEEGMWDRDHVGI